MPAPMVVWLSGEGTGLENRRRANPLYNMGSSPITTFTLSHHLRPNLTPTHGSAAILGQDLRARPPQTNAQSSQQ